MGRIAALVALIASMALPAGADPYGSQSTLPPSVPAGFGVQLQAAGLTASSLAFSADGDTLYVTHSTTGNVSAYPISAGVVAGQAKTFLSGIGQTLGVVATADAVYVSGLAGGKGVVYRARDLNDDGVADSRETVISGLPNGRHNTNGLAIGPDGMLYITNGNATDSGFRGEGGAAETPPYSGSVLRVDPAATGLTPSPGMVVATGFRNVYDIAFLPGTTRAFVPTNGPDGQTYNGKQRPLGEDVLARFDVADGLVEHFQFPWCLHDRNKGGLEGFVQAPADHPTPSGDCSTLPPEAYTGLDPATTVIAKPVALFGTNVSADGLAFNPGTQFPEAYDGDLFVTEFGNFFGLPDLRGHKVVRVRFDAAGEVAAIEDFMTGLFPLDLTFAPDGSMWVASFEGAIYRVFSLL